MEQLTAFEIIGCIIAGVVAAIGLVNFIHIMLYGNKK